MSTPTLGDTRLPDRFWSKVRVAETGCWEWQGHLPKDGYGRLYWRSAHRLAHRVAYSVLVGPIPASLQIDHLCRNHRCVNPAHLEVVTSRVNTLRGTSPSAVNATKTHCPKGHPLTPENNRTDRAKIGERACRKCAQEYERRRYVATTLAQNALGLSRPQYRRMYGCGLLTALGILADRSLLDELDAAARGEQP